MKKVFPGSYTAIVFVNILMTFCSMLHAQQNYQILYKTVSNAGDNYPMFQSFADFNYDGKTDFLVEERFPGPAAFNGNCKVYEFTGSGYTQKQLLTIPPYSDAYTANYGWDNQSSAPGQFVADADKDGTPDLLIAGANGADCGGNFVRIYWGSSTAPQFANSTYTQFSLTSAYCVGSYFVDYDNDGFKDVYIRNAGGVNMMYHNNGDRTFTQVPTLYPGRDLKALWDDYDQDGYADLCYIKNGWADGEWGLRLNKGLGSGNFGPTISNFDAERPMYFFKIQSNPLLNNSPDIVFNCMSDGTDYRRIYVAEWNNTTQTFNATHFDVQPGNNSVIPIRALDYNLDGYEDILLRYRIGTTTPARFNLVAVINDGYGNFTQFDTIVSNVLWTPGECYKIGPDLHISGAYDHTLGGGGEDSLYVFGKPLNVNTAYPVSITISSSANPVCQGTSVTYTAIPVNGGTTPSFQWKVNGVNAGGNSSTYNHFPVNGDVVSCTLTSNLPGATGNPATSNSITMTVTPSTPVSVTITATANPVCQGTSVTYTATPVNGGANGFLQWYVNGVAVTGNGNVTNGLVAHYPFNGNTADATGNSQNAVPHGNVSPTTDRMGNPNSAYYIGGNTNGDDYLTIANSSALAIRNPFSESIWINKEVNGGWIVNKGRDIVNAYGLYDCGGNAQVVYAGNNGAYIDNTTVSLNQWHLYTCVFKGDSASFYLDGLLASKQKMSTPNYVSTSTDYPMAIGRHFTYCCYNPAPPYWSYPYKGKVDDLRLYNRALSTAEVLQLFQGSSTTYTYVPQDGDVVTCVLTASGACLSNNPDTSNAITMIVHPLPADIGQSNLGVTLTNDSICLGSSTVLNLVNSQPGIKYQLYKNNVVYGPFQTGSGNTLTFPITGLTQTSSFTITAINPVTTCGIILDSTFTIHVSSFNASVSPNTSVCSGSNTTISASGGTNYTWSNGMTTSSIVVAPVATTTYYVTVTNGSGCSHFDSVTVSVLPRPVPVVTGPAAACLGSINNIYTTQPGMSGYTWTVSTGGTITSGAGTNAVSVTWAGLGTQNISVTYTNGNGCNPIAPGLIAVVVSPIPAPTITGNNSPCINSGTNSYQTEPGMINYQWTTSAGGNITLGSGTNAIQVQWTGTGSQWVRVNYSNISGCSPTAPSQYNVTVNPLPGPAGLVTGTQSICAGVTGATYSTGPIQDALNYVWSLPPDVTVVSGAGTNFIVVNFGPNAVSGQVSVAGNNLCGNGPVSPPLNVSVGPLPWPAGQPVGEPAVCHGDTGIVYYVTPILGALSYSWNITNGGVITSGNGTNSIWAKFPVLSVSPCEITVYGINACGHGNVSPVKSVTVKAVPETPVITQSGSGIQSNYFSGNQWYYNGILIPGSDQQTLYPEHSGDYFVIVTLDGCPSDTSNIIHFIMTNTLEQNATSINVFPVPGDGCFIVTVRNSEAGPLTFSVLNNLGVKIYEKGWKDAPSDICKTIDLRPISSGVYTLVIESQSGRCIRKIVVQH